VGAAESGPDRAQVLARADELGLGAGEVPAGREDAAVGDAARAEEAAPVPRGREVVQRSAPLLRAGEVAQVRARGRDPAQGPSRGEGLLELLPDGHRRALLEPAHALGHGAAPDEGAAEHRQGDRLRPRVLHLPGDRQRARGVPLRAERVGPDEQRVLGGEHLAPRLLGARRAVGDERPRAAQPGRRRRVVAPEVEVVRAEPHRHPRRGAAVARAQVAAVRLLAGGERGVLVALPPRGPAQPLERGGVVAGRRERRPRRTPVAAPQRRAPGGRRAAGVERPRGHGPTLPPAPADRGDPVRAPAICAGWPEPAIDGAGVPRARLAPCPPPCSPGSTTACS
jgi:hypothetical protein